MTLIVHVLCSFILGKNQSLSHISRMLVTCRPNQCTVGVCTVYERRQALSAEEMKYCIVHIRNGFLSALYNIYAWKTTGTVYMIQETLKYFLICLLHIPERIAFFFKYVSSIFESFSLYDMIDCKRQTFINSVLMKNSFFKARYHLCLCDNIDKDSACRGTKLQNTKHLRLSQKLN